MCFVIILLALTLVNVEYKVHVKQTCFSSNGGRSSP